MARITCVGQIGIGLAKCCAILGLDRAIELGERLIRNRGDHVGKGNISLRWMGVPEPSERAFEISKLHKAGFANSVAVGCVVGGDEVHADVGTI